MKIPFFLLIFFHTVSFAQFTPVSIEDKKAQIQINKSLQNLTNDIRRKDLTTGGTVNGTVTVKNANIVISTTTGSYGIKFQDGTLQTTAGVGESTINVNTAQFFGDGSIASPLNLVTTSVTLQGNTFNGASQLVRTNSSSQVPLDITGNAATATSVPASGVDLSTVTTRFVAIEESTGTFVLRTGDTMTGQLTISGSSLTVTGAGGIGATYGITAATFTGTHYGDGANLTGIPASAITAGTFGAGDYIFTDSTMWLDLKHTGSGGSRLRFYNNAVYDSWLYDNSVGNVFEIGTNLATLNMVMGGNPLLSFSTTAGTLTGSASLNVLKAGDTMTGPLTVQTSSITVHSLTANANFNGFRLQDDSALPIDFQINGLNSSGQVTTLFVGGSSNRFGFRPMAHASDIVFMNSSGVGIGKNTPEYALDIGVGTDIGDGAIRTLGQAIFTGSATVQGGGGLGVTYGITAGSLTVNNNATITGSLFSPNVTATTGNSLTLSSIFNISAQSGAGYPIRLNTDSSADINLVGGGGRVGINKVPPAYMLDVTGGGHFTSSMTVDGAIQLSNSTELTLGTSWGSGLLTFKNGVTTFGSWGAVGLTANTGVISDDTNLPNTPAYRFVDSSGLGMFQPGANNLGFATVSVERIRINEAGNIGIGMTSPVYRLDVTGGGHFTSSMTVDGGYYGSGSNITLVEKQPVFISSYTVSVATGILDLNASFNETLYDRILIHFVIKTSTVSGTTAANNTYQMYFNNDTDVAHYSKASQTGQAEASVVNMAAIHNISTITAFGTWTIRRPLGSGILMRQVEDVGFVYGAAAAGYNYGNILLGTSGSATVVDFTVNSIQLYSYSIGNIGVNSYFAVYGVPK